MGDFYGLMTVVRTCRFRSQIVDQTQADLLRCLIDWSLMTHRLHMGNVLLRQANRPYISTVVVFGTKLIQLEFNNALF